MKISLAEKIHRYISNNNKFTLSDLYSEFGDTYKKHSIRARVYDELKGTVIRTGKGSYVLAGIEIEAIVEQADSREHIFEIKKANIFYDLVFLDIPYKTWGQRSGGNNPKRNMADYSLIDADEFGEIIKGVESVLRSEESQIYFMIAGGRSSSAQAQKYIRMFDSTNLRCNDIGSYTKVNSNNGKVCNMGKYQMPPEAIFAFSADGKIRDCTDDKSYTLDFTAERPKLARYGGYPTAKPLEILKKMVNQATHKSEWILDLFGGSGNMLEAAISLGRKAHIVEICDKAINKHILPKLSTMASGGIKNKILRPSLFDYESLGGAYS